METENLNDLMTSYSNFGNIYRHKMSQKTFVETILSDKTNLIYDSNKLADQKARVEESIFKLKKVVENFSNANDQYKTGM